MRDLEFGRFLPGPVPAMNQTCQVFLAGAFLCSDIFREILLELF